MADMMRGGARMQVMEVHMHIGVNVGNNTKRNQTQKKMKQIADDS